MLQAPVARPGLFFTRVLDGRILILTMRKKITTVYVFLASVIFAIAFTFRYYKLWSRLYSWIFIPKRIRNLEPLLRPNPDEALSRTLKLPYRPDGHRELFDVCAAPGLAESKIIGLESGELVDLSTSNDCDDSARHVANSLDPVFSPYLVSIICTDRRELKYGIFPKFPGHCVCVWIEPSGNLGQDELQPIYHMGNWNSRKDIDAREFKFTDFAGVAKDLASKMAGDENDVLAWLVMDPYLRTCAWGIGMPPSMCAIELGKLRPMALIG